MKFDRQEGLKLATGGDTMTWPRVNGQGQTMVVIPGPVEFVMGSPLAPEARLGRGSRYRKIAHAVLAIFVNRSAW